MVAQVADPLLALTGVGLKLGQDLGFPVDLQDVRSVVVFDGVLTNYGFIIYTQVRMTKSLHVWKMWWHTVMRVWL